MQAIATVPAARGSIIAGWVLSGVVIAFLVMDGVMKLLMLPVVIEISGQLGWAPETAFPLGLVLLACTALYAWPRTAVLGAILLTGYLGGAIATHVRIGSPLFSHILFGVYIALFVWGGLWLRNPRLRELMPFGRG